MRFEDARLLVVDKPSSMPVHPCGNFRHNSCLHILARERGLRRLFVVHRLDAVTSGLILLAKDAHTARRLSRQIGDKEVRKEYVARVQGHFPESMQEHVVSSDQISGLAGARGRARKRGAVALQPLTLL